MAPLPHPPPPETVPAPVLTELPHPLDVGNLLARYEIQWIETCREMKEVAARASDATLPAEVVIWAQERCRSLQLQEAGLRAAMAKLIPPPVDPNLKAYQDAYMATATAYHATMRAYFERQPARQP